MDAAQLGVHMDAARLVNRERIVVLGWGRAILLQLAHPLVAAGVRDHSGFSAGPMARLRRLHATVGAMVAFTFGDDARVSRAAARINAVHDRAPVRSSSQKMSGATSPCWT